MARDIVDIPDPWYKKNNILELLELRESFYKCQGNTKCTCDYCIDATRCSLAYDAYNTDGDCLLSK